MVIGWVPRPADLSSSQRYELGAFAPRFPLVDGVMAQPCRVPERIEGTARNVYLAGARPRRIGRREQMVAKTKRACRRSGTAPRDWECLVRPGRRDPRASVLIWRVQPITAQVVCPPAGVAGERTESGPVKEDHMQLLQSHGRPAPGTPVIARGADGPRASRPAGWAGGMACQPAHSQPVTAGRCTSGHEGGAVVPSRTGRGPIRRSIRLVAIPSLLAAATGPAPGAGGGTTILRGKSQP